MVRSIFDWRNWIRLRFIANVVRRVNDDEVNVEDVEEIVQETAASLSNDELKKLTEQEENKNIESSDFEEEKKELSMAFVKRRLTTITEIMDQFVENDPNFDRSSKARRGVIDALSTYQQLLTERKRKSQTPLDAFLTKRQKIGNTE
uniref:Uncharacterized protein n=1 Tax=Rhodnius prolixus TaxID=13249 RepID=T1IFU6_RHOPR